MKFETAIIGGTGFDQIDELVTLERKIVRTPYGDPSGLVIKGKLGQKSYVFLARHGASHAIPPHKVNYRANLWALKKSGVKRIIAFAAVGGIPSSLSSRDIVIPDQLIDYTYDREHTFFDGEANGVDHIDFTWPYSSAMRSRILKAAARAGIKVVQSGCYAATQGPRLETAAEIDRLERDGATIVGMTGMPEAALAREIGLEYACVAIVVNPAAGRGKGEISLDEIKTHLLQGAKTAISILKQF